MVQEVSQFIHHHRVRWVRKTFVHFLVFAFGPPAVFLVGFREWMMEQLSRFGVWTTQVGGELEGQFGFHIENK